MQMSVVATPPVAFSVIAPVDAVHPASVTAGAIASVLLPVQLRYPGQGYIH